MFINSREAHDSESIRSEAEWDTLMRRKAFAVGILALVWAGGSMPPQMIQEAKRIRRQMRKDGTWLPA